MNLGCFILSLVKGIIGLINIVTNIRSCDHLSVSEVVMLRCRIKLVGGC